MTAFRIPTSSAGTDGRADHMPPHARTTAVLAVDDEEDDNHHDDDDNQDERRRQGSAVTAAPYSPCRMRNEGAP